LLRNIRQGKRPKFDPRNRLILRALSIIRRLSPRFVVFENVCEMRNTMIEDENGKIRSILDIIDTRLGNNYVGKAYDIQFADYGIPQRRKRLITVYTLDEVAIEHYQKGVELIPDKTHSKSGTNELNPWTSVTEALRGFPPLDAKSKETASNPDIPFHRVPVLDKVKYEWIKYAPPGASAFDSQCNNPKCKYKYNRLHGTRKNHKGINQSNKNTPLYCERCGSLLPRPYTVRKDGSLKIMSGYTSAYKRMDPILPCPALTRNLSYPCSDHKIHPFENRVLSLAEAFVIQTLSNYDYIWGPIKDQKGRFKPVASDTLIRLVLGESIPPKFTELLGMHLIKMTKKDSIFSRNFRTALLFR
ncbi:DNA cytosine methyltransferase, partial [bacterium]|nr:DNA cytosine methyltransferase [bacterium]